MHQDSDCYSMGVVIWEIFTETIPWAGMNAMEIFTTVVINRGRLNTDSIPWNVVRRLIINLFTNQPIHRHTCDKVKLNVDLVPSSIKFVHFFKIKKIIQGTPLQSVKCW